MIYDYEGFVYDNNFKYIITTLTRKKINLSNTENVILTNLLENNFKVSIYDLQTKTNENYTELSLNINKLRAKLKDVAKIKKQKEYNKVFLAIKCYTLSEISKLEKNKERKKILNRSSSYRKKKDERTININSLKYPENFILEGHSYKLIRIYKNFANYKCLENNTVSSFMKQDFIKI